MALILRIKQFVAELGFVLVVAIIVRGLIIFT